MLLWRYDFSIFGTPKRKIFIFIELGRIREDFMKKKGIAAGVEKLEEVLTGECEDGARR